MTSHGADTDEQRAPSRNSGKMSSGEGLSATEGAAPTLGEQATSVGKQGTDRWKTACKSAHGSHRGSSRRGLLFPGGVTGVGLPWVTWIERRRTQACLSPDRATAKSTVLLGQLLLGAGKVRDSTAEPDC